MRANRGRVIRNNENTGGTDVPEGARFSAFQSYKLPELDIFCKKTPQKRPSLSTIDLDKPGQTLRL